MGLKLTSLSEDYQRGAWGLPQAVREIISNGLDGAERGQLEDKGALSVDYSPRAQRLTVTNQGVTVPASALLLGVSQSRDYAGCIGTFGEGLPMALLVLARLRRRVVITNGDERWEPKIVASPDYDGRVLAIQSRKLPKDHDCFSVVFEDVTSNDVCPFSGKELCLSEALPTGSPRDDHHFSLKPTSHDSPSFPEAPDASSRRCLPEASPDRAPRTPQHL
jgi:hypothetical protein